MKLKYFAIALFAAVMCTLPAVAQAAVPHKVTLNWLDSTDACVTAVNIHKATTSGGEIAVGATGSNFAVVAKGVKTFTDNSVVANQVNFWTVSAWGPTCGGTLNESVMSNEVKTTVPPDPIPAPAAPTALTAIVQ